LSATDGEHDVRFELACFELGGTRYALDVAQLREIARCPSLAPLPDAPALIEGIADLRGSVLPIVDLGRVLGREPASDPAQARLVVVQAEGLVLGLRVSASVEVIEVAAAAVEALPALAAQAGCEAVRAVVRRSDGAPLLVLSLEALIERVYRSARCGEAA
jgi:purine-binding chemotaxis protein CheW